MNTHAENSTHDEVTLLLPWYVNGKLADSEQRWVEEHVRSCIACRRALPAEYRTLEAFRNESPLDQSVQAGFERLHTRIAARAPVRSGSELSTLASVAWRNVTRQLRALLGAGLRPALLTASLAAVVVGFGLTQLAGKQQTPDIDSAYSGAATASEGYHTLASAAVAAASEDDVNVIFAPYTSNERIEKALQEIPARIVAGPDNTGVYTVRLIKASDENERRAAIEKLRNEPHVIFAEAAQPLAVSNQRRTPPQ